MFPLGVVTLLKQASVVCECGLVVCVGVAVGFVGVLGGGAAAAVADAVAGVVAAIV